MVVVWWCVGWRRYRWYSKLRSYAGYFSVRVNFGTSQEDGISIPDAGHVFRQRGRFMLGYPIPRRFICFSLTFLCERTI